MFDNFVAERFWKRFWNEELAKHERFVVLPWTLVTQISIQVFILENSKIIILSSRLSKNVLLFVRRCWFLIGLYFMTPSATSIKLFPGTTDFRRNGNKDTASIIVGNWKKYHRGKLFLPNSFSSLLRNHVPFN